MYTPLSDTCSFCPLKISTNLWYIDLNDPLDVFKSFPLLFHKIIKWFTVSLLFQLMLNLYITFSKNLSSTSSMASTAAFRLKQVYTINLLNLMLPDTVMQANRIINFFLRGAPYIGLHFSHNGKYKRPKALTTGRPNYQRLDFPYFYLITKLWMWL